MTLWVRTYGSRVLSRTPKKKLIIQGGPPQLFFWLTRKITNRLEGISARRAARRPIFWSPRRKLTGLDPPHQSLVYLQLSPGPWTMHCCPSIIQRGNIRTARERRPMRPPTLSNGNPLPPRPYVAALQGSRWFPWRSQSPRSQLPQVDPPPPPCPMVNLGYGVYGVQCTGYN